jgi:hypothetical protein
MNEGQIWPIGIQTVYGRRRPVAGDCWPVNVPQRRPEVEDVLLL